MTASGLGVSLTLNQRVTGGSSAPTREEDAMVNVTTRALTEALTDGFQIVIEKGREP